MTPSATPAPWAAWQTGRCDTGLLNEKDSLTGKEEGILNLASGEISKEHVKKLGQTIGSPFLFKKGEIIGAITLIKRLWPTAWLMSRHGFRQDDFKFPDTRNIAEGKPFDESGDDEDAPEDGGGYFAVLAFDGDEMGKWISGTHPQMPKLGEVLAYRDETGIQHGALAYFASQPALKHLLDKPRPLNPSFHLQFSEMLGAFSNICARRVVEAFDGCLIYSGGDDVLALLPSDQALACAQALRSAFRCTTDLNSVQGAWEVDQQRGCWKKNVSLRLFQVQVKQEGFVRLHPQNCLSMEGEPKNFPAILPGPATDCSVGIAIAHFKSPLQDVVRAAQAAEKRAKNTLGRAAVAVSLFKRSGETLHWGCKWEGGGIALYQGIARAMSSKALSSRFPHRVCQLLERYVTSDMGMSSQSDAEGFQAADIIIREFAHAISRQSAPKMAASNQQLLDPLLRNYLSALADAWQADAEKREKEGKATGHSTLQQTQLNAIIGLCTAVAFAHRTRSPESAERQPQP